MKLTMIHTYFTGGKYHARMLHPGSTSPTIYFGSEVREDILQARILLSRDNAVIVSKNEFEMELDHIKLFGERSNGDLVLPSHVDDATVIAAVTA